ncbi:prenyltransferase/squalene oxidase repeat-containing protein [Streptomyces iconiensis]|uniref:prenyltransferase/squalene oxidase repeat-containing protein n=1 Tax=Streptomyces iconiensis TaxID=1384038 RepID=UPI00321B414E
MASAASAASTPAKTAKTDRTAKLPEALYGRGDPKYDGVWRQSLALLALDGAGAVPAKKAVDWLTGQQCDDGSFAAYRADASAPCDPKKAPADINATTMAAQALAAVGGRGAQVGKAVDWLKTVQNKDGGWGYAPGSPSDANSTSLAIGALRAMDQDPEKTTTNGRSAYEALLSFQLTCGAKGIEDAKGDEGAFAYQPDKKDRLTPNNDASSAAALAGLGEGILSKPLDRDKKSVPLKPLKCATGEDAGADSLKNPRDAADAGAAYVASALKRNGGHFTTVLPGSDEQQPDYANTADAVIALAAGGHRTEADKSLTWLGKNLNKWDKAKNDPAAISTLMLASRATGNDPTKLAGTNLLTRLNKTGPAPAEMPESDKQKSDDDGGTIPVWAFIIVGLAVGAGFGILMSGRRKRQQL